MKKMLAVTAMAALVAGAAFAAPTASIEAKVTGNFAQFDTEGDYTVLGAVSEGGHGSWDFTASVEGEKAGAKWDGGASSVWFKPVDMLKFTITPNKYCAELSVAPLTVNVDLPGNLVTKANPFADGTVAKVTYAGGDLGTLWVQYTDKHGAKDGEVVVDYTNTVAGVGLETKTTYGVSAKSLAEYLKLSATVSEVSITSETNANLSFAEGADVLSSIGEKLTVSMPVADMTAKCVINDSNFLAKTFAMNIDLSLSGKYDVVSWTTGVNVDIAAKTTIKVPFTFKVGL